MAAPRHFRPQEEAHPRPLQAVRELTMRCDHACAHCGWRAAQARPDELRGAELLAVADQLAAAGTREVTRIGGEAHTSTRPACPSSATSSVWGCG